MKKKVFFTNAYDPLKIKNMVNTYVNFTYDTKTGELKLIDSFNGEIKETIVATVDKSSESEDSGSEGQESETDNTTLNSTELASKDKDAIWEEWLKNATPGTTKYIWWESVFEFDTFLDEIETAEDFAATVVGVGNVFQVEVSEEHDGEQGIVTRVITKAHTKNNDGEDVKQGFWVDDKEMNDQNIALSLEDAFARLIQANYPVPHSQRCVLRRPFGPTDCNPQYIFGNVHEHTYVDATTGDVSKINPCGIPEEDEDPDGLQAGQDTPFQGKMGE